MIEKGARLYQNACLVCIPSLGVLWILGVSDYLALGIISAQVLGVTLGLAVGAAMVRYPYGAKASAFDLLLGVAGMLSWFWMAYNFDGWLLDMGERTPDKWVPGAIALILLMEGLRKSAGKVIALLVWVLIAYAFFGDHLAGALRADVMSPTRTILYFYSDTNGVPGIVLRVVAELVLAFIIFGKMLEASGATSFLNDLALGWMGHRRGGPAKVSVVASGAFGSISGSTVANIMSTGVVTIPMMKRAGYKPAQAAAIEAVASNGGQIAPPVMGATAFIIAEFLEITYGEVVLAAAIPAALYFFVVFLQVDAIAVRDGIRGIPKGELPKMGPTFARGWVFLLPIAVLLWFLLGQGYNAGISGLYACGILLAMILIRHRGPPTRAELREFFLGSGENLVPLLLIAGAAGIIMGVLNSTGLAFQLSIMLTSVAQNAGVLVMLLLTAVICIAFGMGMPTAAVYIVLVSVVAPALTKMGLSPLAAHMFIFYFGLLSMLTPPVAIASMVAARIAEADLWRTGFLGLQLGITAYLLPFLWAFNPAILLDGSAEQIAYAGISAVVAGVMIGQSTLVMGLKGSAGPIAAVTLFVAAIAVGSATIWIGSSNPLSLVPAAIGICLAYLVRSRRDKLVAAV